jgi:predicted ArsR family transcriptional regulator
VNKFPKGNKMSLEQRAQVLEAVVSAPCGVRDVALALTCRASRVVSLLKEMEGERLIELEQAEPSKRGRPKKLMLCTPLGFEFLEAYKRVQLKPLRAREADLERAVNDALYAERLVSRGHDVFKLFMELNMIARNIEESSEATESTGTV